MKIGRKKLALLIILFLAVWAFFFCLIQYVTAPVGESSTSDQAIEAVSTNSVPEPVVEAKETTFTIAGDMMFDRYINHTFKNIGFDRIFDNLDKSVFANSEIRFANLEGPVSATKIADDYPERSLSFNMPPETIPAIKNLGLNAVSLANNHTLNAGANGFTTSKNLLTEAGIKFAGSYSDFDENSIMRFDTAIPVSIIVIDYLAYSNNDKIAAAIAAEKTAGYFVIVSPHWGTEYELTHSGSQAFAAQKWIDSGADLIVGGHPHVVQDVEIYKNKPIIYSLGNFVFDQTFSAETQQGLIVSGKNTAEALELTFYPTQSIKLYPQLATAEVRDAMLARILKSKNTAPYVLDGNTISLKR